MTLKELLNKVEFDDIIPFIKKHYPNMANCMAGFKMAFDGMRNTIPSNSTDETVTVQLYRDDYTEPFIMASHVDNDVWKNVVGREVVINENVKASLEEIVAVILYDATYYGFTPTDREETFEEWETDREPPKNGNPYRTRWWNLTQREHDSLCSKENIGKRTYTLDTKHPFRNILRDKSMNRSKRMRAHRWKKRIDQLDRLANRWDLLQKIKSSVTTDADLLAFENLMFKTVNCEVHRREDFSKDAVGLSYIYDLLAQYDSDNISRNVDFTLLWIQTPKKADNGALAKIAALFSNTVILQDCSSDYERTRLTIVQLL